MFSSTALFSDATGTKKLLTELQGNVEWDKDSKLVSGKDSFLNLMTAADNGEWKNIDTRFVGKGFVIPEGGLALVGESGTYTIFGSTSDKGLNASDIDANAAGWVWEGKARFNLGSFSHNFSGGVSQDIYSGKATRGTLERIDLGNGFEEGLSISFVMESM